MTEQTARILLIDLENCPSQINDLMGHLEQYSQIIVCYAQCSAKIPIDWIVPLTAVINEDRLKLIKTPTVGKNAADFGITFWAGILMAQLPEQTHFDIISNDTDLDYVVGLLIDQKRSAERIGIKKLESKKESTIIATEIKATYSEPINYLREYCLHLHNYSNKPAKKETLLNSIRAKFKANNIDANQLLENLVKRGVITINESKITYNQDKLRAIANTF
jgi:hypothetical protein